MLSPKYEEIALREIEAHKDTVFPKHLTDGRENEVYIRNVIAGWQFEDQMVESLSTIGKVSLSGSDKDRKILVAKKIKKDLDLTLSIGSKTIGIDIQFSNHIVESGYAVKEWKIKKMTNNDLVLIYVRPLEQFLLVHKGLVKDKEPEWLFQWSSSVYKFKMLPLYSLPELLEKLHKVLLKSNCDIQPSLNQ